MGNQVREMDGTGNTVVYEFDVPNDYQGRGFANGWSFGQSEVEFENLPSMALDAGQMVRVPYEHVSGKLRLSLDIDRYNMQQRVSIVERAVQATGSDASTSFL